MIPAISQQLMHAGRDPFTKALLHFDGTNGQTGPFADAAKPSRVWTGTAGATLTTAQSKFGGSALNIAQGHYVATPNDADFDFGAGDFTVEWFEYPQNYPNGSCIMSRDWPNTWGGGFLFGYAQAGQHTVYMTSNGSAWDIASGQTLATVAANVWQHTAISRQGSTFRTFKNGAIVTTWSSSLAIWAPGGTVGLGVAQNAANIALIIEELRVSKGICRYTGAFTPPTLPFSP